tara:strand:+ start:566 stop:838 length:273 start_codon:yes stop_codon:yes gene_type:complete
MMAEGLMYYLAFALGGGVTSTLALYLPAMRIIREEFPESMATRHNFMAGIWFFGFATVLAPAMIVCLYFDDAFIESFIKSVLKIDQKNNS